MNAGELKRKIPIIAITAYNDEKKRCLNAGMKAFCKKLNNLLFIVTKPASSADIR